MESDFKAKKLDETYEKSESFFLMCDFFWEWLIMWEKVTFNRIKDIADQNQSVQPGQPDVSCSKVKPMSKVQKKL